MKTLYKAKYNFSFDSKEVKWSLKRVKKGHSKDTSSDLTELRQLANEIHNELNDNPKIDLTGFVYYAVNRAVLDIPLRILKTHSFAPSSVSEKALDSGAIDLQNEWWQNSKISKTADR